MPQIVRFGCAGVAVIIIAALTSVGLYAVLTGGFPFGGPAPKPLTGGAQVLVTIQAGQPTPTPPSASTRDAGFWVRTRRQQACSAWSADSFAAGSPTSTQAGQAARRLQWSRRGQTGRAPRRHSI